MSHRARGLIREIPDYPEPGVLFRDLGPVLADPVAFREVVHALSDGLTPDVVVGVEARGFLLGAAVALHRETGVVGLRKLGKLPVVADRQTYDLEYGSATLELPDGALRTGQRVLVVDDVLATGGTAAAAIQLCTRAGARVVAVAVVVEIAAIGGRRLLGAVPVRSLMTV